MVTLSQTIPALPVRDAAAAVGFYRDRLGFETLHHDGGFAVVGRDEAVIHLWQASDEGWRERNAGETPVRSGSESFIVLHPVSKRGVDDTDFGTREFATLDQDGNLVTFFQWMAQ